MRVLICQRLKHGLLKGSGLMTSELEAIATIGFLNYCNIVDISYMLSTYLNKLNNLIPNTTSKLLIA